MDTDIQHQATKAGTAWAAAGLTSWADWASFLAFLYSAILIFEWFWKRFLRDFAERRGWVKKREYKRRASDYADAE